jgi:hypothetical protein
MGVGDESSVVGVEMRNLVASFVRSLAGARGSLSRSDWYSIFLRNNFFSQGPLIDGRSLAVSDDSPKGGQGC